MKGPTAQEVGDVDTELVEDDALNFVELLQLVKEDVSDAAVAKLGVTVILGSIYKVTFNEVADVVLKLSL